MSFRFRFASVLRLRCRDRDLASVAVEEVVRAIALLDNQLTESRNELQALAESRKQASHGNVAIGGLIDLQRHQLVLMSHIQQLDEQRSTLMQEKTRRDYKLMKAQQAVKSLERLAEQQQAEAKQNEAKQLQSRLDEWSHVRKR